MFTLESVTFKRLQADHASGVSVRTLQNDGWRNTRGQGFFPAVHTKAPAVAGFEAGETPLWLGGDQVVAASD